MLDPDDSVFDCEVLRREHICSGPGNRGRDLLADQENSQPQRFHQVCQRRTLQRQTVATQITTSPRLQRVRNDIKEPRRYDKLQTAEKGRR